MIKICVYCGKEFKTYDKRVKYCSRKCGYLGYKKIKKEGWLFTLKHIYNEHWKEGKSINELSKYYKIDRCTLRDNLKKYGFKCRTISEMRKLQCKRMTLKQRKKQTEKANMASYKGASSFNFRNRVFKFYPNVCVMCGERNINKLVAHHIIPQEYNKSIKYKRDLVTGEGDHRVRNGIIVCTKCHKKIHKKE